MKNSLASLLLFGAILSANPTLANSASSETQPTVCEFVAKTASKANSSLMSQSIDPDKGAPFVRNFLVQNVAWHNSETLKPNISEPKTLLEGTVGKYYESHIRWSHSVGYLPYLGEWFEVLARTDSGASRGAQSTGAFLSAVMADKTLACVFENNVEEDHIGFIQRQYQDALTEIVDCKGLSEKLEPVRADMPFPQSLEATLIEKMAEEFERPEWFKRNIYFKPPYHDGKSLPFTKGPILHVDIDNDGAKDVLLRLNYSETSRVPCGATYFELLSDDMSSFGDPELRSALLSAQGMELDEGGHRKHNCGRSHDIVSVEGQTYLSSHKKLSRHIWRIDRNESLRLCQSKFTIKPEILYDAYAVD